MEARLGVGIFEIPTLPPSVPGVRLREALEGVLMRQGVQLLAGRRVIAVRDGDSRCTEIVVGTAKWRETLEGEVVILATGRFLGEGSRPTETVYAKPHLGFRSRSRPPENCGTASGFWTSEATP